MKNQKGTEKLNIILRTNDLTFNKIYAIIQNNEGGNVMSLLKMLLIFYGESVIFTFVTCEIFVTITMKRIKKDLNRVADGSQINFMNFESIPKSLFLSIIPIFNIIYPLFLISNYEKIYPEIRKEYIDDKTFFSEEENGNIKSKSEEKIDYKTMTPDEKIAYLEAEKQKFLKFQELYGNEKSGETLDKINEHTEAQESKPKTYSLGNNSNLKHK